MGKATLKFNNFNTIEEYKLPIMNENEHMVAKIILDMNVVNNTYEFSEFTIPDNKTDFDFQAANQEST